MSFEPMDVNQCVLNVLQIVLRSKSMIVDRITGVVFGLNTRPINSLVL